MRFSPVVLPSMTALVLAGCASIADRPGSTTKRKLTWPGKNLPSDRIAAEERAAAATAANDVTVATSRSVATRRTGTGNSTYSGATTAVPGVGHTVILIEEPVLFPHGYHHGYNHGYHYHRGRTYRHRYPHTGFPSGGYRPSTVRSRTILLDATSGRKGPSTAPSGGSKSTAAPGSNIAPALRQSDLPAYRP